ncbi:MAG: 50S ribosomal protein L22 [Candidatus Moranbacteria bacterium GW2011_GWF2_36_839]|nr:MAG: 50S ribosomal protein L22 [Candidatus Moranbacteria bacterium GW2011_GWF1_36_78]KKQ16621.1 MAG: 50S ribosomal protein L22 [Candidatus Moranbacteria bacterium GW2011_GWF2_36_839]HAT73523.1 50S ribosomal protein L22 [Candidatus Moranbacteria bacterium]HBY11501.1 50S ribosomal protein L22 [Candidatus Moranbacteria bacterium]
MKVNAKLNNLRIAPRKSKLVADLIKGLDVLEALDQLEAHVKRTSPHMKKLLLSAIANAENNFGLDKNNLYVFEARIGAGPTMKRWMPKAFGRAGEILKRTSKIEIILEERVEGKNRKTKEEMEAEMKKREKERKKEEKEQKETQEKSSKDSDKKGGEERAKKETPNKGWAKKIFQRKSM